MKQKTSSTLKLQLCSKCLNEEINSWINENWKYINDEARKEILLELRTIKIKEGECAVCRNPRISDKTPEKILRILEENKIDGKIKEEFRKYFVSSC